jgi:hypothetical protein
VAGVQAQPQGSCLYVLQQPETAFAGRYCKPQQGVLSLQEGTASLNKGSGAASTSESGQGSAVVYSLLGAVRRVMRLAQHQIWSQQLATDGGAHECLNTIVEMHLKGHPMPGVIVQGALWTQYFLLLSDAMHMHSMAAQSSGAGSNGLSQTAVAADISAVAERARDFVGRVHTFFLCACMWAMLAVSILAECVGCLLPSSTQ